MSKTNGRTSRWDYDAAGQLTRQNYTDVAGIDYGYEYDSNNALVKQYRYALGFAPLQYKTTNGVYDVHADQLSTPRAMADQAGSTVWATNLSPYGVADITRGESLGFNIRFPGQYADGESGLYYNRFRDYASGTGRYFQSDPIGLRGGLNAYVYAGGNPVMYIDPTGEIGLPGAAIGGMIGGVSAFTGALATGSSITDALIAGSLGAAAGAATGLFGGVGIGTSAFIGGGTNLLGQVIGNNIDKDPCNNTNINLGAVVGSAIGGVWAAGITRGAGALSGAVIGWGPST
ncbi:MULTISPECIES: RHS repeat-associated core domain-containing protein [unclassified Endozoicomonas]|uniref:RHS repeat-associated core domain-containing protein n=1 Tax=unclassified Endozoicomonas TaxID=2644528 RepID=UPI003BB7D74A